MGSTGVAVNEVKPHVVCIPYPAQGHVNPMLKLAKLLHHKGFHVTFVNTEFNHGRLLKSRGPNSLDGLPSFRFETIPDGLPPTDVDATQDIPSLCVSTSKTCLAPFRELLKKLNTSSSAGIPPVTGIVSDGVMSFTMEAAKELGVPEVIFWSTSACGFLAYLYYRQLAEDGIVPLKDPNYMTNGYLDTVIDRIPGMKEMRLKDFPSFVRTSDPNDIMFNFLKHESQRAKEASAVVINTYDTLEHDVLEALSSILPTIYTIGPLALLVNQIPDKNVKALGSNLWKEDPYCLKWLDTQEPNSVVYVNFGSITVMTAEQLVEFAWGLANSGKSFLWIIRPDLVVGEASIVPPEFVTETKERGLLASWCPQEQILNHPAIGGFLTHSGWNSTIESISSGVPVICWPFFAEQQTNCRYSCREWGIGMEIEGEVLRGKVEKLVRELMSDSEKAKDMKKRALELKKLAEEASFGPESLSYINLDNLIEQVLLSPRTN
ncbi:7-deoxyloganetin glucosyltransferase-like [Humulus lupulus]|uniref:7-deoxyloganetin glucosyltransferase-like n=1 Tax=Humulus lupulus TaxID=3486 RepID=UPI002B414E30|nr:7-deoxyloganetin glucosyltransferase-like [Humulus lupulus]